MADQTKTLAQFQLTPAENGRGARLHIEDDGGETLELSVTRDQLDVLADMLDDYLSETEDADEVDDEDEED
ncbi:hypothetical protein [Aurantimonas sp. VKM B-3413]|uniref:hypothetical protein n=1 Tax=Aurantimonas sp. VKM B-3413 TaxID=2779401 RepID=UPI001E5C8E1F|nr:hypothetical protein [Aurantimonas sp. VKM B-3413]MCB8840809.1 hypothetical protein [Aurantimonas sp. VKM B-3413]